MRPDLEMRVEQSILSRGDELRSKMDIERWASNPRADRFAREAWAIYDSSLSPYVQTLFPLFDNPTVQGAFDGIDAL